MQSIGNGTPVNQSYTCLDVKIMIYAWRYILFASYKLKIYIVKETLQFKSQK